MPPRGIFGKYPGVTINVAQIETLKKQLFLNQFEGSHLGTNDISIRKGLTYLDLGLM